MGVQYIFCRKFNSEKLLCKAFFTIISMFFGVQPQSEPVLQFPDLKNDKSL